jgi:mutator protein MutT
LNPPAAPGVVHVVAAAVTDAEGRVLIARRPPGKHLAGSWEFPGGKVEPGETRVQALGRELREELGITLVGPPRPLIRVRHGYSFGEVLIDMWVVTRYEGEPTGLDGQKLRWCTQDELAEADLLPADRPIVRALRLPERLTELCTPSYKIYRQGVLGQPIAGAGATGDARLRGVLCANAAEAAAAVGAGANFLVLCDALADGELATLCDSVPVPVFARGIGLERSLTLGASGLNEIGARR